MMSDELYKRAVEDMARLSSGQVLTYCVDLIAHTFSIHKVTVWNDVIIAGNRMRECPIVIGGVADIVKVIEGRLMTPCEINGHSMSYDCHNQGVCVICDWSDRR